VRWEMKRPALAGSRERPLLQAHCGRLALGYVWVTSSCIVRVWGCLRRPVGRGSGRACVCQRMNQGCRSVLVYVLYILYIYIYDTHCGRLVLGYAGVTSSCTVRVWGCLQSPVGRGSGRACMCPRMNMGCYRVPAWGGLFAMPRS
jgi:hypothetical protein